MDQDFNAMFKEVLEQAPPLRLEAPPPISMLPGIEQNLRADVDDMLKLSTALEAFVVRVLGDQGPPAELTLPPITGPTLGRISELQDVMKAAILRLEQAVMRTASIG